MGKNENKTAAPLQIGNEAVCFWSWNDDMDAAEICRQLREFAQGRFGGVVIHARAGLRIPYMGREWFDAFRVAVDECRRLGLHIFIYDEDGWPSGFAAGRIPQLGEEYCFKRLAFGTDPAAVGHLLAAYRRTADGCRRLDPADARPGDLFFGYTVDRHYADLLYPDTTKKFIELVYQRYADELGDALGTVVQGAFTDEPQLNCSGYPWSAALPDAYRAAYGRDLFDELWLLTEKGEGYAAVRRRFWQLVGRLFRQNYTGQIAAWCASHGLALTGHFACEDGLCDQISSSGGVMGHYALMQLPGIDHLGDRVTSPVLAKQTASVSRQLGSGQVLSETFGCAGWGVTFARLSWIWGRQTALGITKPCFHLAAYSMEGRRKRDYPAFFSYQEPWWDVFPAFMDWMEHNDRLMSEGERLCRVLVISPIVDMMGDYREAAGDRRDIIRTSAQFRQLVETLLDLQVDVEIGDEGLLAQHGFVGDGCLHLGRGAYDWVFTVGGTLEKTTVRLLEELLAAGGKVAHVDRLAPGAPMSDPHCMPLQARHETIEKYLRYASFPFETALLEPSGAALASGVLLHRRRVDGRLRLQLVNTSFTQERELLLRLEGAVCAVRRDDCGGEHLPARCGGGYTYVPLTLAGGEDMILDVTPLDPASPAYPIAVTHGEERAVLGPVTLGAPNCLTVDRAQLAFDDAPFSAAAPMCRIIERLYGPDGAGARQIRLRYTFTCRDVPQGEVTVAFEDRDRLAAACNGTDITGARIGWWIDRQVGEYRVTGLLHGGENTVELTYRLPKNENGVNVGEVFETERNRFFYPLEPDGLYVRGDFDVLPVGQPQWKVTHYAVPGDGFVLAAPTAKTAQDLTPQGLWFYRGDAAAAVTVRRCPGERLFLRLRGMRAVAAAWSTPHGEGLIFRPPYEAELTAAVPADTDVTVTLRLIGDNRDLLGPHHHIGGEVAMVGPSTFRGRRGFEDFVSPQIRQDDTWTDDYNVIPFTFGEAVWRRAHDEECRPLGR